MDRHAEPRFFATAAAFRAWLEAHAATSTELLVGFHKVGSGKPSMTWSESVDEAVCFGWIDGVRRNRDAGSYTIRFTPRKRGSNWSAINIAKVERLRTEGRMTPAGEAAFAQRTAAKSAIYAYEQSTTPELTADEMLLFRKRKAAWRFFEATPPWYKRTIVYWVTSAKREATRVRRLAQLVDACEEGRKLR